MKDIEVVKVRNLVEQYTSYTGWMHNAKTKEGRSLKFDSWKKDFEQVKQDANSIYKLLLANNINVLSVAAVNRKQEVDWFPHKIVILLAFNNIGRAAGAHTINEIIKLCDPSDELTAAIRVIVSELEKKLK